MKREIFTKQKLSNGDEVTVFQIKGIDMYNAQMHCANINLLPYFVMIECCAIDGKRITLEYIHALYLEDLNTLLETMTAQMNKVK